MQSWLRRLPGTRTRRAVRTIVLGVTLAALLPASALAASFTITPHIANHAPIINKKWPVELIVKRGKTKLSGTVVYQFLFSGSVVARRPLHGAYRFRGGVYRDQMIFTPDSNGQQLTLRFVVRTRYGTRHLDWKIQPRT